jgi:hypothetical protein
MRDLPQSLSTRGWSWERFEAPSAFSDNFWIGTDCDGNRWLTKLRSSFYAYREIVFARLAQEMKWSCQSSVFLKLDKESAYILGENPNETHAAHWYIPEHKNQRCSEDCDFQFFIWKEIREVDDLVESPIANILDWPKSELAAYLFGGNEPPGRLITTDHKFVIIDSEQMFSSGPDYSFRTSPWWNKPNGKASQSGRALFAEVCADLTSLTKLDIEYALSIPRGIKIQLKWSIAENLRESRKFAASFSSDLLKP